MAGVVVGVGIATVDYLCVVATPPQLDRKMPMERFAIQGGGPVATALVTVQRLGMATSFIGKVGDDSLGQYITSDLWREGVDTTHVVVAPGADSPFAIVIVEQRTARRTILYYNTGLSPLSPDEIPAERIRSAAVLHVDGHHMDAQIHAATMAREARVPVVYDAGSDLPRCAELVALTDVLVTSEHFPADFTGERKLPRAMSRLLEYGPRVVVTTLGPRGCRLATREDQLDIAGLEVGQVVDTTGAGDVFHGAFIYALMQQWDLRRVCDFANVAAGLKCRSLGGRAGIPTLKEIERAMLTRGA